MNLQEAYSILELSPGVSAEEAKKRYRELTKKFHPDVNKDPGAEDRFKKINEAYRCLTDGPEKTEQEENPFEGFNPFTTFNHFNNVKHNIKQVEHISLYTTISFQESILGCKKEFRFNRRGKCAQCHGQGTLILNNNCPKCYGRGQIIEKQNNMIMARTCDQCMGRRQSTSCVTCQASGMIETEVSVNVTIPGGIQNNNVLRLSGMGHYIGSMLNIDQYSDAHLRVLVTPTDGLRLVDQNVVSDISISLLEALVGTNKTVDTVMGKKEIVIPPLSKNKEEVIIPNLGVGGVGSHKVILQVEYPKNINNLINALDNNTE